jgi:hypothetical protein
VINRNIGILIVLSNESDFTDALSVCTGTQPKKAALSCYEGKAHYGSAKITIGDLKK